MGHVTLKALTGFEQARYGTQNGSTKFSKAPYSRGPPMWLCNQAFLRVFLRVFQEKAQRPEPPCSRAAEFETSFAEPAPKLGHSALGNE